MLMMLWGFALHILCRSISSLMWKVEQKKNVSKNTIRAWVKSWKEYIRCSVGRNHWFSERKTWKSERNKHLYIDQYQAHVPRVLCVGNYRRYFCLRQWKSRDFFPIQLNIDRRKRRKTKVLRKWRRFTAGLLDIELRVRRKIIYFCWRIPINEWHSPSSESKQIFSVSLTGRSLVVSLFRSIFKSFPLWQWSLVVCDVWL